MWQDYLNLFGSFLILIGLGLCFAAYVHASGKGNNGC